MTSPQGHMFGRFGRRNILEKVRHKFCDGGPVDNGKRAEAAFDFLARIHFNKI